MKFLANGFPFLIVFVFLFTACSDDEDLVDTTTSNLLATSLSTPNGGGGGGGVQGSSSDVADINPAVLSQWTDMLLEVERYAEGMRPNASARAFAYINLAAYEALVPGMSEYSTNADRLEGLRIREDRLPRNPDWQIVLNTVYSETMDHFLFNVPRNIKSGIASLERRLNNTLSENVSNRVEEDSRRWGRYVARQVIAYSQTDRSAEEQIRDPQPLSYEPPTGDGYWTYSADAERAWFPYWESVRTFAIAPDQTTTVAPVAYSENSGSNYFTQMMEVYTENNSAKENDDEQLWIAEFWSDDVEGLMMSPPARQFSIANQLVDQYNLDLEEALVLYLKLGFSLNDAAVSTWKYKYEYMVMRPNVFIHEFIDPEFQTNLYRLVFWPNPSFPGYPSGHSCFASAAAGVFIDAFGSATNFTDRSHEGRTEFRGAPRTFTSFEQMADENGYSRIPLGVHVRMDCTEGLRLGYEIANAVNELDLNRQPN